MPTILCVWPLKVFNVIYDLDSGGSILCLKREHEASFGSFVLLRTREMEK